MNHDMVSLIRSSVVLFIFFPSFLQLVTADTTVTYLLHFCNNNFNYTQNSVFQNNLNLLIANLSTEAPPTNFYISTFGQSVDKVYGLLFCPSYIASQDCHNCIQSAAKFLTQNCPNQKGAIIFYVECVLRYANYSFFSTEEGSPSIYWRSPTTFYNPDQFDQVLTKILDGLITKAAFGSSTPTFATGEGNITESQQLYCFVQCTPDINGSACNSCLLSALADLQNYSYGNAWYLFYGPNCQIRYSLAPFYDVASSTPLIPSGPPLNTVAKSSGTTANPITCM